MGSSYKHIALFVNPNGQNQALTEVNQYLCSGDELSKLSVIGLAESLPIYAQFPSSDRKERIEATLKQAAVSELEKIEEAFKEGVKGTESHLFEGRFPAAVIDWLKECDAQLFVKQSLPSSSSDAETSKGDIKLSRACPIPLLLLHGPIKKGGEVLLGLALSDAEEGYELSKKLISSAVHWASTLDAKLKIVHCWDLWGEDLLRSRSDEAEVDEALKQVKDVAQKNLDEVLQKSDLDGVEYEATIIRGDSGQVIDSEIAKSSPSLVVLGATATKSLALELLGSTAESVIRKRQSPVLVIR